MSWKSKHHININRARHTRYVYWLHWNVTCTKTAYRLKNTEKPGKIGLRQNNTWRNTPLKKICISSIQSRRTRTAKNPHKRTLSFIWACSKADHRDSSVCWSNGSRLYLNKGFFIQLFMWISSYKMHLFFILFFFILSKTGMVINFVQTTSYWIQVRRITMWLSYYLNYLPLFSSLPQSTSK